MEVVQRYWMLELIAFWEGQINTKPLMNALGLTRQSVSQLLKSYQIEYPNTLFNYWKVLKNRLAKEGDFSRRQIVTD